MDGLGLGWMRVLYMHLHVHVKAYILYIHNMQQEWKLAFALEYHIG